MADNPTPNPPIPDKPEMSDDVIKDKQGQRIKSLETKISQMELKLSESSELLKTYELKFAALKGVPSQTNPGKSLLQEIDEWIFPPTLPKV